ncbi:unnamed protein product [Brassica rapa subsp. trilocularis]
MYSLEIGPLLASFRCATIPIIRLLQLTTNPRGYLSPQILWRPTNPSTRPETRKRPEPTRTRTPELRLEEVAVTTGEEDEDAVLDLKSKLYRFDKEANQWKERGAGTVKLLKHKDTGKIRLVMRQSKTLKICANHFVKPGMAVQEHVGNEKSCVWHARDFADGELKDELFCIRFASIENCKLFMQKFNEVAESEVEKEESKDASETAGLLEKLTVEETKTEEKVKTEVEAEEKKKSEPEKADEEKKTEEAAPST